MRNDDELSSSSAVEALEMVNYSPSYQHKTEVFGLPTYSSLDKERAKFCEKDSKGQGPDQDFSESRGDVNSCKASHFDQVFLLDCHHTFNHAPPYIGSILRQPTGSTNLTPSASPNSQHTLPITNKEVATEVTSFERGYVSVFPEENPENLWAVQEEALLDDSSKKYRSCINAVEGAVMTPQVVVCVKVNMQDDSWCVREYFLQPGLGESIIYKIEIFAQSSSGAITGGSNLSHRFHKEDIYCLERGVGCYQQITNPSVVSQVKGGRVMQISIQWMQEDVRGDPVIDANTLEDDKVHINDNGQPNPCGSAKNKGFIKGDLVWDKCDLKIGLSGKILNGTLSSEDSYQSQEKRNGFLSDGRIFNPRADTLTSPDKLKMFVLGSLQMIVGVTGEYIPSETKDFGHAEKENLDMFDWSRIYISSSVKERSKKQAKNGDKGLQHRDMSNELQYGREDISLLNFIKSDKIWRKLIRSVLEQSLAILRSSQGVIIL